MRTPLLVSFVLSSGLLAQSPLQTNLTPINQGNLGGGLYFDMDVHSTVSITRIESWAGTLGTTAGQAELELWLGPTSYVGNLGGPGMWSHVATATATGYLGNATNQLLQFDFATPVALGPGSYGVALRSQSVATPTSVEWNHAYTNGLSCTGTGPGTCTNTLFSTLELTVRGGAAQNTFFAGPIFQPRMWAGSLHYTSGGAALTLASWQGFGTGCASSSGLPTLAPVSRPVLGQSFAVDVVQAPVGTIGFSVYGLSNTAWYYVLLPLDLGYIGMPGCRQYIDIVATTSFGPGAPALQITGLVPNASALTGLPFFLQAVLVDPAPMPGNLVGMVTTNALAGVVGL